MGAAVGFPDIRAEPVRAQVEDQRTTVAARVGDDFLGRGDRLAVRIGDVLQLIERFGQCVGQRGRVAVIGA